MCIRMYVVKFTILLQCMWITVLCVGASADIKDSDGKTPLQWAKKNLARISNPEVKQQYQKVREDTHTWHSYMYHTFILPVFANRSLVQFSTCLSSINFSKHESFAIHFRWSFVRNGLYCYIYSHLLLS